MFNGVNSSGITESVWFSDCKVPDFPILKADDAADVCIIGGGIVGLTTAYLLCEENKSVIVLEDGRIASGESGRTTAHLASGIDDRYFEIERVFGQKGTKLVAESHRSAIDQIEKIIKKENIDCDFKRVPGYLFLDPKDKIDTLKKELMAAHRAGLKEVELLEKPNLKGIHNIGPCLRFPDQAQFHVLKYLISLAKAIIKKNGKIYEKTHARDIDLGNISQIKTNNGATISARSVVIATNEPIYDSALLFTKQKADRTYVIGAHIGKDSFTEALFWDTGDPYHYIRLQSNILLIGGEDNRTGKHVDQKEKFNNLKTWALQHIPELGEIEFFWSGQIMEPADHLAFIGKMPSKKGKIFVATGDSGNGLTHGTIAGMLLTDLIVGKKNPWSKIYDPTRKPIKNLLTYFENNLKGASEYLRYLKPADTRNVRQISANAAETVRRKTKKIGVYRDKSGKLHECSLVCTHLGGLLQWNEMEHTWDCPVHGSRFTPDGIPVNGPAKKPLKKIN